MSSYHQHAVRWSHWPPFSQMVFFHFISIFRRLEHSLSECVAKCVLHWKLGAVNGIVFASLHWLLYAKLNVDSSHAFTFPKWPKSDSVNKWNDALFGCGEWIAQTHHTQSKTHIRYKTVLKLTNDRAKQNPISLVIISHFASFVKIDFEIRICLQSQPRCNHAWRIQFYLFTFTVLCVPIIVPATVFAVTFVNRIPILEITKHSFYEND